RGLALAVAELIAGIGADAGPEQAAEQPAARRVGEAAIVRVAVVVVRIAAAVVRIAAAIVAVSVVSRMVIPGARASGGYQTQYCPDESLAHHGVPPLDLGFPLGVFLKTAQR